LWSVLIVKCLPYTYGLKWFIAQCIAVNSCSVVDLLLSPFVNVFEAYVTKRFTPSCDWLKTAPQACLLEFVVMQNSLLKSGYCNRVGWINAFLRYSKAFWHSGVL